MSTRFDVVVVGAGPAGSSTAAFLGRRGLRVALLERSHFPRPKACGEYLSPGVVDILERTGLGSALAGAGGRSLAGIEIVSPAGVRLRLSYRRNGVSLPASSVARDLFDAELARAAAESGADLFEGVVARTPILDRGRVIGVEARSSGSHFQVFAPLTVVADGARSILSRHLGLAAAPRWPVRLGLVAHAEGATGFRDEYGEMHLTTAGYCGMAPLPGGRANVGIVVPADALRRSQVSATKFFDAWIERNPRVRQLLGDARRVTPVRGLLPIGARARTTVTDGAVLVGDAAGFFDPFTGEGIYRAIRGAELAAAATAEALDRGDTSARALSAYDRMRREEFRSKEAVTRLVQAFVQFPRLMDYSLPRLARRPSAYEPLAGVLGDVVEAQRFLNPGTLWTALRP
jgi:geranylgeranyl reductase family protein